MEDLEQQLRNALARKDAPEWFEAKAIASMRRNETMPPRRPALPGLRWASALLATVLLVGGVAWRHERAVRERAAAEDAKARLDLALKITRAKLQKINARLTEVERDN